MKIFFYDGSSKQDYTGLNTMVGNTISTHFCLHKSNNKLLGTVSTFDQKSIIHQIHPNQRCSGNWFKALMSLFNLTTQNMSYYFADVIYPCCPVVLRSTINPTTQDRAFFARNQKAPRKSMEQPAAYSKHVG